MFLTGTMEDSQVVFNAGGDDSATLVLDNASITNSDGSALYVQNVDEAIIYTESGTTNTLTDGATYTATGTDDPNADLYSTADLTLAGESTLNVTSNYADGISTTDGLVIASGTRNVTATENGIRSKDYVDILAGTIAVDAEADDGIKSTKSTDEERG